MSSVNRESLGIIVRDTLDLPIGRDPRIGPEYKVVSAILKAITDALLRGEEVSIAGFGIFKVETKPPNGRKVAYPFPLGTPPSKTSPRVYEIKEAHKVVKFYPSKVLTRYINEVKDESHT